MYTADFNQFAWEIYKKKLDMRYFYLGRYFHFLITIKPIHLFSSIFNFGRWKWCITHSFYLGNILFEINVVQVLIGIFSQSQLNWPTEIQHALK